MVLVEVMQLVVNVHRTADILREGDGYCAYFIAATCVVVANFEVSDASAEYLQYYCQRQEDCTKHCKQNDAFGEGGDWLPSPQNLLLELKLQASFFSKRVLHLSLTGGKFIVV
jgi:hypothetical protein